MTRTRIKILSIVALVLPLLALVVFTNKPVKAVSSVVDDPATVYKAKCAMCHTPKAEKFYDPSRPEEEQVQAILKGKKGEKPPYMPAFEEKGITEDGAKALVAYMKTLKPQ
ncbi:MAG: c-type cytochrome [Pyrinomonadaceae bacterium]